MTATISFARPLADFVDAYNFARRLKTLRGLSSIEAICKTSAAEPHRFRLDPSSNAGTKQLAIRT